MVKIQGRKGTQKEAWKKFKKFNSVVLRSPKFSLRLELIKSRLTKLQTSSQKWEVKSVQMGKEELKVA